MVKLNDIASLLFINVSEPTAVTSSITVKAFSKVVLTAGSSEGFQRIMTEVSVIPLSSNHLNNSSE